MHLIHYRQFKSSMSCRWLVLRAPAWIRSICVWIRCTWRNHQIQICAGPR